MGGLEMIIYSLAEAFRYTVTYLELECEVEVGMVEVDVELEDVELEDVELDVELGDTELRDAELGDVTLEDMGLESRMRSESSFKHTSL